MHGQSFVERWSAGDGPAVVFLHGFAGSLDAFSPVLARLDSHAARLGVRLPGHHPQALVSAASFEATVDQLAASLRVELAGRAHLVGYSLGGRIALGIAIRHPGLVARLSLIGTHPGLSTRSERQARQRADARWVTLLRADGIRAFVDAWQRQPIFATQQTLSAELLARQRCVRLAHDPEQLAAAMETLGLGVMSDWTPHLSALRLPVELVAGQHDPKFALLAERMAERLPHATLYSISGAGHNVVLEAPDHLARILRQ